MSESKPYNPEDEYSSSAVVLEKKPRMQSMTVKAALVAGGLSLLATFTPLIPAFSEAVGAMLPPPWNAAAVPVLQSVLAGAVTVASYYAYKGRTRIGDLEGIRTLPKPQTPAK